MGKHYDEVIESMTKWDGMFQNLNRRPSRDYVEGFRLIFQENFLFIFR